MPMTTSSATLIEAVSISACVRFVKIRRAHGTASPPAICAPATMAAANPAIEYAFGSPYNSSRYGWAA